MRKRMLQAKAVGALALFIAIRAHGARPNPLLEKYTHTKVVKTVFSDEGLPELQAMLEDLDMGQHLKAFYAKSIYETRYVLRLNDMDLRMLNLSKDEIKRIKQRVQELKREEAITTSELDPLLTERNSLTYGRLFVHGSTSSYEYYLASFGAPPPLTDGKIAWAEPRDACNIVAKAGEDLEDTFLLVERGGCSFIDKANNVSTTKAAAMILINSEEELFSVAATLGLQVESEIAGPNNTATIMVRKSVQPHLEKAMEWGDAVARIMPLRCGAGGPLCLPVLPEERAMELQVDSGYVKVPSGPGQRLEFMSATFGSTLPTQALTLVEADPPSACGPLVNADAVRDHVVLAKRGTCSFGDKAINLQNAGARVVMISDYDANSGSAFTPLQNIGAPDEQSKRLSVPGVFVTARAGDVLREAITSQGTGSVEVTLVADNRVAKHWQELGAIQWPTDPAELQALAKQLRSQHAHSIDAAHWVDDKLQMQSGGQQRDEL